MVCISATENADYTADSGTLSFAAGASGAALTQGFTVTVNSDSVHEADEQFTVELSNATGTGASIDVGEVTVTISDNEMPALSIGNASATEGAGSIEFPVTLSLTSEVQITVDYATSAGTATGSDDFTAADGTLTFAPGARSRTISVSLLDDAADEDDETFTVTLSDPAAAGTGSSTPTLSPASAQGTIVDDDGAPQLSIADAGAAESAGEIHFAVSLDPASNREVSASWSTADGTATAGSDYTAVSSGTLTIAAESTSATLTVTVAQDTDDEPSETFTVTLDNPVNGELADASATGTIEDDDSSVVTITAVSTPVTEGNPAVFELSRVIADDMDLAVTLGGSKDDDFVTASLPNSATIPSGQSSTTVSIATVDDGVTEDHGSVMVTIGSGNGYTPGTPASATVAIQDDDAAFTLAIAGGDTVSEAVVSRTFTVTLSPPSVGRTPIDSITVRWATADGSATAGADYTADSGTLSFAAGASGAALTQQFTVVINDDGVHEADEQFTVTLSNATGTGATIGTDTGTATVTIEDNDVPELSIAAASANENGGTIGFPVTLSPQSEVLITVGYATSVEAGDTVPAGSGSDFTAANGTLTFMAGTTSRTISVSLMDDTADEDNETFTVTLSGPTAAGTGSSMPTLASPGWAQGTIVDDDGLPLLSIAAASVGEGDGSIHFEVSLDPASAKDVSASWSTADVTAEAGSDYGEETGGTLTIAGGATSTTATVAVRQDDVDEPPETFTVTLSGPVNGELSANDSATGTIEDDDLSTVSITAVSTSVTEGNPAEFAVSRGIEDDVDLAVTLSSSETGGFITAALPTSATIPSGASSTTVSIATDDNEDDDDDGSVTVEIQADDGYAIGTASATVAIQDDDVAYRLEIAGGGTVDEGAGSATLSVTLSETSPTEPITVQWATADGTATSPADYTAAEGALTFATAATGSALTQQLTVAIEDDNLNENDEAFTVTLSNAGGMGAIIATGSATVTITDNEATPVLSIADATAAEDRRMIRFPVTLNPGSGAEVTVDYATTDGTAAAGSDFTAVTGGTLTFAPGATARMISISLIDDEEDEADETFTVTLSNASANAELASDPAALGTIVNDDGPVEVTVEDVSCLESIENLCRVSVDLDKTVSFDVVLNLNTADGTATGGAAPGNVFAPGDDFKIRVNNQVDCTGGSCISPNFRIAQDQIDEEDETFTYTVTLVGTPHAVIVRGTGTVTIEDDDPPSSVSIADGSAEEDDGTISFVVSLDHESGKQIGVAWATADGTAVAGQDYQAISAVVNFAPGVTTQTISVALIDDSDREPDGESFRVTLSRAAGTDADDLDLGDQGDAVATGTINPSDLNIDPTGAPTITGTPPTVGEALAVDTSAIDDADGLTGATFAYQWMVDDGTIETDVDAATAAGYTPRDSDVGKTIRVRVTFTDDNGTEETLFSAPTETVAAAPPAQVTNVTVEADVGQLTVSWDEVSGASGYKVQWKSGTEEFNATDRQHEITGGSTTTYTIPSLAPGTEYTVQVSATKANARVDGAPSAPPVTATPKAVSPGQVTGVALTPAAEALQVTWGPVATADGYRVQWRSGTEQFSAERQEEVAGATTATHTIAGLDPDTTYTVQVIATRQFADDGPASPSAADRPQYQPPARVTGVSVTAGVEQFSIIWRVVTDADGYRVQWKSGAEEFSADRQAVPTGDSLRPYFIGDDSFLVQVIPSLIPGTEYTVQVIATRNNAADGEPSEPATVTPQAPAENQVSGVTVEAGVGRLLVSWSQAAGAIGYRVQWRAGAEDPAIAVAAEEFNTTDRQHVITGGSTTTDTIDGLDADVTYSVQVSATFANYDGPPSSSAPGRPQYPAPGQVTGVAVEPAIGQLQVTWSQVDDATGYRVQWRSGAQEFDSADREAVIDGGATTEHTIPALAAGTEYTVQVSAVRDNAADGPPSEPETGTPLAPLPGRVAGVSVEPEVGQLTVTWSQAADATGYKVQWKSGAQEFGADREAVIDGATATEYTIPSLQAGTEYTVQVIATNLDGEEGEPSLAVDATPKTAPPEQVINVTVEPGVEQLAVSWDEVADAGGYQVQWRSEAQEFGADREAVIDGGTTTEYTIQALEPGTEYTVQVIATAENADDGPPSAAVTGTPLAAASGQVSGVRVAAGVEQLTVSWNPVSEATGYQVQWRSGEDQEFATADVPGDTTEYTIGSLAAGTEYTVQVVATRENAEDGAPSAAVTGIPLAPAPGQVTNVTVTPGAQQLAVAWDAVTDADGYRVQWTAATRDFSAEVAGGSTTEYTIRSLSPGVEYTVQVLATKENAADGPPSVPMTGTPEGGTPGTPDTPDTPDGDPPSDDATPPTVTITTTAGLPSNAAFTVTITFSESVTGLALTDLEVSNGGAANLDGSGSAYTVEVTPRADFQGTVTVTVPAAAAADAAGNGNLAHSADFAVDTQAPTVIGGTLDSPLEQWTDPVDTGAAAAGGVVRYPDGGSANAIAAQASGRSGSRAASSRHEALTLTFDETLDQASTPAPAAFAVRVGGVPREVAAVTVSGSRVSLTLAAPVPAGETVTVSYSAAAAAGAPIRDLAGNAAGDLTATAAGDLSTALAHEPGYGRVSRALLPYAAAAMHAGTLAAIGNRVTDAGSRALPRAAARPAGAGALPAGTGALAAAAPGVGGAWTESGDGRRLAVRELLRGADFELALAAGAADAPRSAAAVALWGSGDYRYLSGGEADAVDWSGDLVGFQVGADLRVIPELLAGVAVAWAEGAFDYRDRGTAAQTVTGVYETELLSVHPYAGWSSPGAGVGLWMSAGYGWGEVRIDDDLSAGRATSAVRLVSGAVGGSGRLLATDALIAGGTTLLRLQGEGFLARVDVDGSGPIAPLALDSRRLRLLLAGSHAQSLPWGGRLTPELDVGLRYDDGDGPQGAGLELGGELSYVDPRLGLTVQGHGRLLATHRSAYEEWGAGGLLRLELGIGGRGLWLSVAPSWGDAAGGAAALWERGVAAEAAAVATAAGAVKAGRLDAQAGYGLPAWDGRGLLTPYGGLTLAAAGARDYRAGVRLEIDALELSLEGARREHAAGAAGPASHAVTLGGALRY